MEEIVVELSGEGGGDMGNACEGPSQGGWQDVHHVQVEEGGPDDGAV